jgi:PPM family protein phosphatase
MHCLNAELTTDPAQALVFMGADRHVGGRAYQQDQVACLSTPDLKYQFLVVADGVGGHWGGELASKAVIDVARDMFPALLGQFPEPSGFLEQFCRAANHEIRARAGRENKEAFSTVVALLTTPERAYWAHVGDSRLYGFKGAELVHQTRDHSLVQVLFDQGKITAEERAVHPERNRVLQVLGMHDAVQPTLGEISLTADMAFLLCTDGFWEQVSVSEMPMMLAGADLNFSASVWVRQAARRAGAGGDNVGLALWRTPPRSKRGWLSFR